jgi:hypothetical protein
LAEQYGARYGLPMLLSETNLRGSPSDRASWLRYTLEQYELAVRRGVPMRGYCWFPYVDSCDWDSLLARPAGRVDPVGVVSLGGDKARIRTSFTVSWETAAAGASAADLPAYRFQPPCDSQLAGLLPLMQHWDWQDPPAQEFLPPAGITVAESSTDTYEASTKDEEERGMSSDPSRRDLVVLSHLRWTWVWQRPQHLVSRFAGLRAAEGARTWFVEEPVAGEVNEPEIRCQDVGGVTRVWLVVPRFEGQPDTLGFDAKGADTYGELLSDLLARAGRSASPDVLLYTPMALDAAQALSPRALCYDVMDDLTSFRNAPQGLLLRQRRLLAQADVVFAGGRSLHRWVSSQRRQDCYLFASGVETAHYASSRQLRGRRGARDRNVAGYVGVIDERLDLDLVGGLALALADWTVRIVGPVAKIDPASLPRAANLEYPGMTPYGELPSVMAGFDVALMPFARNEATRSISPTKTLEYLAAGLPVVSTRVSDVVTDYSGVVHFADDAGGFAAACREVVEHSGEERDRRVRLVQARHEWDAIAAAMAPLLGGTNPEARRPRRWEIEEVTA